MKYRAMIPALLLALFSQGCSNLSYYSQSISGQISLLMKRNDIHELVQDQELDKNTRIKLQQVLVIREFASKQLQLPDNNSYKSYADLGRPYAVWNVFAAPVLSIKPKTWCFPVAGCVPYRGYFKKEDALNFAESLKQQGYDVHVGGIAAYSTLGWFDDPVLNTILNNPEPRLAGLLFHELAHQKLYVKDDSTFNESFATAVEIEGVRRWLARNTTAGEFDKYLLDKKRHTEFITLLLQTREQLDAIYHGELGKEIKLHQKQLIFSELRKRYEKLKRKWQDNRYDNWFRHELNNARLVTVGTYHDYVPAFQLIMKQANGNLDRFYAKARELADMDRPERKKAMLSYTER